MSKFSCKQKYFHHISLYFYFLVEEEGQNRAAVKMKKLNNFGVVALLQMLSYDNKHGMKNRK